MISIFHFYNLKDREMKFSDIFLNTSKNQKQYLASSNKKVSKLLIADLGQETFEKALSKGYTAAISWLKANPQVSVEQIVNALGGVVKLGFFYNIFLDQALSKDKIFALIPYLNFDRLDYLFNLFTLQNSEELINAIKTYHSEMFTKELQLKMFNFALNYNKAMIIFCAKIFDLDVLVQFLLDNPDYVSYNGKELVNSLPDNIASALAERVPKLKLWHNIKTFDTNISWKELLFGEKTYAIVKNSTNMSFGEVRDFYTELLFDYQHIIPHNFELLDSIMQNMNSEYATMLIGYIYDVAFFSDIPNSDWNAFFEKYPKILTKYFARTGIYARAYSFAAWSGVVKNVYNDNENFSFRSKILLYNTLLKSSKTILPDVHKQLKEEIDQLLSTQNLNQNLDDVATNMLVSIDEYVSVLGEGKTVNILDEVLDKNDVDLHNQLITEPFYITWGRLTDQISAEALTPDFKLKLLRAVINASGKLYNGYSDVFKEDDLYLLTETPEIVDSAINLLNTAPKEAIKRLFFTNKNFTPEECKNLFVEGWKQSSRTSASNSVQSVMLQMEEFKGSRKSNIYFNARTPKHFNEETLNKIIHPEARNNIQQFLKDVYGRTQASLLEDITRDPNIEYNNNLLHLYRGVEEVYNVSAPLESWTSDKQVAHGFDGADILEAWVPVDAVYVSWVSPGWEVAKDRASEGLKESEYILITSKFQFKGSDQTESLVEVFNSNEMKKAMHEWFDSADGKITELQMYLDEHKNDNYLDENTVSFYLDSITSVLKARLYLSDSYNKFNKLFKHIKITDTKAYHLALFENFKRIIIDTFLERLPKDSVFLRTDLFDNKFNDLAYVAANEFS